MDIAVLLAAGAAAAAAVVVVAAALAAAAGGLLLLVFLVLSSWLPLGQMHANKLSRSREVLYSAQSDAALNR